MYVFTLLTHSWLRYLVLFFGVFLLVTSFVAMRRGRSWAAVDERAHVRFLAVLDVQTLLGLLLYFVLSPFTAATFADLGAAMKNPALRFFGVEHILTMLLAVVVAHVGRVRSKKREGGARHRTTFVTQCAWLLLTLSAIPWPGLDIGRPLFRF